jgi:3-dehydroquinate synthase
VLIDTGCLRTLPDRFLSDGMAEVLKYALIADRGLFGTLCGLEGREALFEKLPGIICRCCDIKRAWWRRTRRTAGGGCSSISGIRWATPTRRPIT